MFDVNIYLQTSYKGIKAGNGWYIGTVEFLLQDKTPVTRNCIGNEVATNNRLALLGLVNTLDILTKACEIHIYTDSRYLESTIQQGWLKKWQENNWKTAKGEQIKNDDLWKEAMKKMSSHLVSITFSNKNDYSSWMEAEMKRAATQKR